MQGIQGQRAEEMAESNQRTNYERLQMHIARKERSLPKTRHNKTADLTRRCSGRTPEHKISKFRS